MPVSLGQFDLPYAAEFFFEANFLFDLFLSGNIFKYRQEPMGCPFVLFSGASVRRICLAAL